VKEKIKIKFVDFWTDMNKPEGNYFYELLSRKYEIELSDEPDILFYSNYGTQYLDYKCIRVFFSGENHRPDFTACDYAITFDYSSNPRHLRFPLWALYYLAYIKWLNVGRLDTETRKAQLLKEWNEKKKFCCFIVSNPACVKRNSFFKNLNQRRKVDSAGKYLNNIGYFLEGGSTEKLKFIRDYKFVVSFENSSYAGYTTEKILEPLLAGSIPIYWGDPHVGRDFNTKRFINYLDFETEEKVIDHVLQVADNDDLALEILKENCFTNSRGSIEEMEEELMDFLLKIVAAKEQISPRSRNTLFSVLHRGKSFWLKYKGKIKGRLAKQLN
jgi:hypothetical protein